MRMQRGAVAAIAQAVLFILAALAFSLWLQCWLAGSGADALPGGVSAVLLMGLVTLTAALDGSRRRVGRPSFWWVQAARAFAGAAVFLFLALAFLALSFSAEARMGWPLDWSPWEPWISLRDLTPSWRVAHIVSLAGRWGGFLLAYAAAASLALGLWRRGSRTWSRQGGVEGWQTKILLLGGVAVALCYPWVWLHLLGPSILDGLGLSDWAGLTRGLWPPEALAAAGLDLFAQVALLLWLFQYLWACVESESPRARRTGARVATLLAAALLGGTGLLGIRLQPYWMARYHGTAAPLRGAGLAGAALGGARLTGADLAGANLRRADLDWAHLGGANLRHADLDHASLNVANLRRADLTGACLHDAAVGPEWEQGTADLTGAILTAADLTGARLQDAILTQARLEGANLTGADLTGATLTRANLSGARLSRSALRRVDLSGAILTGGDLAGAVYGPETRWPAGFDPRQHGALRVEPGVNLAHADLRGVHLLDVNLARANLADANLAGADLGAVCLFDANLARANLKNADARQADLSGAILNEVNLRGANLEFAHFRGASLTGARCDARTRWPSGFDPLEHGAVRVR